MTKQEMIKKLNDEVANNNSGKIALFDIEFFVLDPNDVDHIAENIAEELRPNGMQEDIIFIVKQAFKTYQSGKIDYCGTIFGFVEDFDLEAIAWCISRDLQEVGQ